MLTPSVLTSAYVQGLLLVHFTGERTEALGRYFPKQTASEHFGSRIPTEIRGTLVDCQVDQRLCLQSGSHSQFRVIPLGTCSRSKSPFEKCTV